MDEESVGTRLALVEDEVRRLREWRHEVSGSVAHVSLVVQHGERISEVEKAVQLIHVDLASLKGRLLGIAAVCTIVLTVLVPLLSAAANRWIGAR